MERLTRPADEPGRYRAEMGSVAIAGGTGVGGAAIDRLGRFEDFCEAVAARQEAAIRELDTLRAQGKTKSVRFRKLLAQKLTDANILGLLELYGCL